LPYSKVLLGNEEVPYAKKLINSSQENDTNFKKRNPIQGIDVFLVLEVNCVFFLSSVLLELNACFCQWIHVLSKWVSVLKIIAFQKGLWHLYCLNLLMEFCFCVVLYNHAAYRPAWNESETDFVHDTCNLTKKILSWRSNYFLYVPDLTWSSIEVLSSVLWIVTL
jgi:hypothetical protein